MQPVKLAGSPVVSFLSGWHPTVLVDFGLDVHLLELTHDNGEKATWFLSNDYDHICDRLEALPAQLRERLLKKLRTPIEFIYKHSLSSITFISREDYRLLEYVNEDTIRKVLDLLVESSGFLCKTVMSQFFGVQTVVVQETGQILDLNHLDEIFQVDLREYIDCALQEGFLRCLSPVNGIELRSCQSLVIHEHRMAFRFVDPINELVFYIGMTHHPTRIADLYIPSANAAFTIHPDDARVPDSARAAEYLTHFVTHNHAISEYLQQSRYTPTVVCRGFPGMHIGHQLWNELTAYERFAKGLDRNRLPIVLVPNAERGSEAYGPLDVLFPEWAGKVDRSLRTECETLGRFVYRKGYLLFRPIDEHVTTGLSERLVRHASTTPATAAARTRISELSGQGFTLVVLGLRVENRTAVNLYDVLEQTITHVAQSVPKLAVVVDGHNSRLNGDLATAFNSFGQPSSSSPVLTELELAIKLRQRFEYTGVEIISAVGGSVLDSIVWTAASAFFVAIWGAGLAKYRWACNKIGLVLSSRANLLSRRDLRIYDSPEFQESPSPILYIDPASVTDCPNAPVLFPPVNPVPTSYANFHVDCARLLPQIDSVLDMAGIRSVPKRLGHNSA